MKAQTDKKPVSPYGKWLKLLLKIAITIACLWYVSTKIDAGEITAILRKASWWWLAAAFLIYNLSKWFAARRLNINFHNIGIALQEKQNLKLYWLGMFYNLFLPGAVTGDAYKVMTLSKRFEKPFRRTTAAVLLDRFSGLLSLGLIVAVYGCIVLKEKEWALVLVVGSVGAIPLYYLIIRRYFSDFLPGFWSTFFLGALVQGCVLLCVHFVLLALRVEEMNAAYVFIFLVAAIASVLPISVGGGLGVREFVIVEGARYTGLDQHSALMLSLSFYLITVFSSLIGAVYVFRDPLGKKAEPYLYSEE